MSKIRKKVQSKQVDGSSVFGESQEDKYIMGYVENIPFNVN